MRSRLGKIFLVGIMVITASVFFQGMVSAAGIIINEIGFNPDVVDDTDGEFIELYNAGIDAVNIDGYSFEGVSVDLSGITLLPGEFLVLAREAVDGSDADTDSFETVYGDGDGDLDEFGFIVLDFAGSLLNSGELLVLKDNGGSVVDSYDYTAFLGTGADGGGFTVERINPYRPSVNSNFGVSVLSGGTPGHMNSIAVPVPEPSTALLLAGGLVTLVVLGKRLNGCAGTG